MRSHQFLRDKKLIAIDSNSRWMLSEDRDGARFKMRGARFVDAVNGHADAIAKMHACPRSRRLECGADGLCASEIV